MDNQTITQDTGIAAAFRAWKRKGAEPHPKSILRWSCEGPDEPITELQYWTEDRDEDLRPHDKPGIYRCVFNRINHDASWQAETDKVTGRRPDAIDVLRSLVDYAKKAEARAQRLGRQ